MAKTNPCSQCGRNVGCACNYADKRKKLCSTCVAKNTKDKKENGNNSSESGSKSSN